MLDLIVAKAMAKLLEDRYQSIKEFADDMREVRRQMDASKPSAALKAATSPVARVIPDKMVDTATIPIVGDTGKAEEDAKAVPLAKGFDSFDATLRLAAMTDQTEDFREYISETQKMRAYRGKIEPHSPLARQQAAAAAAAPEPAPKPAPKPAPEKKPAPAPKPAPEKKSAERAIVNPTFDEPGGGASSGLTNVLVIGAIVILTIAAIGLVVALVMK
jgi:serine/threonine-protein kinase